MADASAIAWTWIGKLGAGTSAGYDNVVMGGERLEGLPPRQRVDRYREFVAQLDSLLTAERPSITGEYYTSYDLHTVGWGGRPGADGNDAVGSMNGNCRTVPVEVYETRYPWLVEDWSLVQDSGGAGEFRGGLGMQRTIRFLAPEVTVSHVGDRHQVPPWGLHGGRPASLASTLFQKADTEGWTDARAAYGKVSPSKFAHVTVREGDRVHVAMPGGGGFGDPAKRDPAAIASDIAEGYVSADAAERDYGTKA